MKNNTDCIIQTSGTFDAPVALLWKVWTTPEHLSQWWGPDGFTNTIHQMDVVNGGEWKLSMHGPDGTNFPNRSIYLEVIPHERIVYEHFNPHFITTVLFTASQNKTHVAWSMLFDSAEMREIIVKAHKAEDGLRQNMEKLERYLNSITHN